MMFYAKVYVCGKILTFLRVFYTRYEFSSLLLINITIISNLQKKLENFMTEMTYEKFTKLISTYII